MDTVLQGIAGVCRYIDDILVSTSDEDINHLHILKQVFIQLTTHGFRLKLEKCEFLLKSIEYLG